MTIGLKLTREYLHERFCYDENTGSLTWKQGRRVGKEAGCIQTSKGTTYRRVRLCGGLYLVHRIIWYMVHGNLPDQLDHINRNGLDNRISNLREADYNLNLSNKGDYKNNASGRKGVCFCKRNNKWHVEFRRDNKRKHIGYFTDKDEAIAAREKAEEEYNKHRDN